VRRAISPALRIPMLAAVLALAGGALASTPASAFFAYELTGPRRPTTCRLVGREFPIGKKILIHNTTTEKYAFGLCTMGPNGAEWQWEEASPKVEEIAKAEEVTATEA